MIGLGIGDLEGRHRVEQDLAVLTGGDPSRRKRAAFLEIGYLELDRQPGIAGAEEVGVHAVWHSARRCVACCHQGLSGDVSAQNVVCRRGELPADKERRIDPLELQGGEHIAQLG